MDAARGRVELSVDAVLALMLPETDTMLELRPHEDPDLQVRLTDGPPVAASPAQ